MSTPLLCLELTDEADVYVLTAAVGVVGAAVGLTSAQQDRLSAPVTQRGRALAAGGGGQVSFHVEDPTTLTVSARGRGADSSAFAWSVPTSVPTDQLPDRAGLALELARSVSRTALAEQTLLEHRGADLQALYDELSSELETTNQGVVALYAEIDDKSRQLREASDAKTRFLNNISHELRTPGNSVLGLSRLLLDPGADPLSDEQRQQVEFVRSSAEDLLRLVNELLDLAKAESGRLEPTIGPVDLAELFDDLRGTIRPLVTRPEVVLDIPTPADPGPFRSDRTLLRHLLRNLLSNAVKFTERGTVAMTAVRREGVLQVQVSDTGIGIAADDQHRVFEEFFQVRNMLQRTSPGSGLGLPFARRLAGLLGGELHLASTPGSGTTFTLTLPTEGPRGLPAPVPGLAP